MRGDFFPELVAVHLQAPASPNITVIRETEYHSSLTLAHFYV